MKVILMKEVIWLRKNIGFLLGLLTILYIIGFFMQHGFWISVLNLIISAIVWKILNIILNLIFNPIILYIIRNSVPYEEKKKMSKIKSTVIYGKKEKIKE